MTHPPSFAPAWTPSSRGRTHLLAGIDPFYPKGERGRPPVGLERMLRVCFLQHWYARADEALEDAR